MRYSFLHGTGFSSIAKNTSYRLTLNGEKINENIWVYLDRKFGSVAGYRSSKAQLHSFARNQSAWALNFHYGFNSYVIGKTIENDIAKKMNILGSSQPTSPTPLYLLVNPYLQIVQGVELRL